MQNRLRLILILCTTTLLFACKKEENPCYFVRCKPSEICIDGSCAEIEEVPFTTLDPIFPPQTRPSKILLSNFRLTRFPKKRFDGSDWDDNSKPDLYINIYRAATKVWEIPIPIVDADFTEKKIDLSMPIEITEVLKDYVISMYDDDGNQTDEFMAGVVFRPYNSRNEYPIELVVDRGGLVAYKFDVEYEF